jgi:hypothetical protein
MKDKMDKPQDYLTSKEVEKELKISSCSLAHLRQGGGLKFIKKGNAFLYEKKSVKSEKRKVKSEKC